MNDFIGNVSPVEGIGKISGNIKTKDVITGNISHQTKEEKVIEYEGDYNILPSASQEIVLPTKHKKMKENVIIKEIPYYEVSNLSGGNTVYIAGQIEFG